MTELKTGCSGPVIAKEDLGQLGGSVRWDKLDAAKLFQVYAIAPRTTVRAR